MAGILFGSAAAYHFSQAGSQVDVLFLGDTSFGENYHEWRHAKNGEENHLSTRGYEYFIDEFEHILRDATLVIANLETPITNVPSSDLSRKKKWLHYADIEKTPEMLERYNIGVVSLANNHTIDYGLKGLDQTLTLLAKRNIKTCGAGKDIVEARKPYIQDLSVDGTRIRLAVICAFEYRQNYDEEYKFYAKHDVGGVNPLSLDEIAADIQTLTGQSQVFVVAFLHWGENYRFATGEQRVAAQALIDAGADLIIGQGAHLLQELEYYKERWILYGIGNFVFGSPGSYGKRDIHRFSLIAKLSLTVRDGKPVKTLRLYPIFTDNRITEYRSRFVTQDEYEQVIDILKRESIVPSDFHRLVGKGEDSYGRYLEIDLN